MNINLDDIVRMDEEAKAARDACSEVGMQGCAVEDKAMLRQRTLQLLELLEEQREHAAVAIVGHKGYIRELERGTFCRPGATECSNGEVRVYRVAVSLEADGDRRVAAEQVEYSLSTADEVHWSH